MKTLYDSIDLGGIELRNRFIRSATHEGFSPGGQVTEKLLRFYEELANNEVGMIITSGIEISNDLVFDNSLRLSDDSYIDPLKKLTSLVHKANGKIMSQLLYGGSFVFMKPNYEPLGPSAIVDRVTHIMPKEMSKTDIDRLVRQYADAAYRSQLAGFDGVQIQSSAGFLPNKFLSPHYNRRNDEYGGSNVDRCLLLVEIREAIANKCGADYPVFIKLSIDDCMKSDAKGIELSDGLEIANYLAENGYDAIEACGGIFAEKPLNAETNNGLPYFRDEFIELAKKVAIPIIAIGGIRKKEHAIDLINHEIEAVSFSRPFIADTDMVLLMKHNKDSSCVTCFQCSGPDGIRCIRKQ